jgi:antitoxin component HigA of HigAB toxin-antitoxin module
MLATAQLKLAEVQEPETAIQSARAAIRIIDSLLEKEPENTLFRRDRAFAQWILGHSIANGANQPANWKSAEAELQRARLLFADIANRNQLTDEDRHLPKAINDQIAACRQAGGF